MNAPLQPTQKTKQVVSYAFSVGSLLACVLGSRPCEGNAHGAFRYHYGGHLIPHL